MLKKVGVSLLAAMMLSSVALACDHSSIDDEDFLCDFSLVDDAGNKQVSKQEDGKVLKFDKEVVKKIIMEDGYSEEGASFILAGFSSYNPKMQKILDTYIANRTISDEVVDGITIKKVMAKYEEYPFWDAFAMMDEYLKYPNGAEKLDNYMNFAKVKGAAEHFAKILNQSKVKGQ